MNNEQKHTFYEIQEGYRVPLKAIRDAISTVLSKEKKLYEAFCKHGCAIGFFRYKEDGENGEDSMRMRIFHYDDKTLNENLGKKKDFIKILLSVISQKKGYSQFDHLKHFREFYCTNEDDGMALYHLHFNKVDIISFCSEGETVTFTSQSGATETITWKKLEEDLKKVDSKYYKKYSKQLDHLIFSSGMDEVYIIPVPILSSPSILVFFNAASVKKELQYGRSEIFLLLRDLLWKVSDAIFFHLYNRLIVDFTEEPNSFIQLESIDTEDELFDAFIKSVCHILLPAKYSIDGQETIDFFDWYGDPEKCSLHNVSIEFSSKRIKRFEEENIFTHQVVFQLPNYKVPVRNESNKVEFEMRAAQTEEGQYILIDYLEQENKFRLTLQNLYRLIYSYWESIRQSKDFIANRLEPSLREVQEISKQIRITDFTKAVEELNKNLEALKRGEISRPNTFRVINDKNSKPEYEFIYLNVSLTFNTTPFYHFYDMITSDANNIEELNTYIDYSERKISSTNVDYESSKSQLIEWFDNLVELLVDTVSSLLKAFNKINMNDNSTPESFLDNVTYRDLILYYSVYYNKLIDVKIKLEKVFNIHKKLPDKVFGDKNIRSENISNLIEQIKKGDYSDKIRSMESRADINFNLKEVILPKTRDFKKDYRKSIETAINEVVDSHPQGLKLKELFIKSSLVRERNNGTLLFASDLFEKFDRSYFNDWIYR